MPDFSSKCFSCQKEVDEQNSTVNPRVNLPVCDECEGTAREKAAVTELLEGMAEGFVCGCI